MTFEGALKRLAEREPEKFEIYRDSFLWRGATFNRHHSISSHYWTQDDIDQILSLMSWECEVWRVFWRNQQPAWGFVCRIFSKEGFTADEIETDERQTFPDKLSAAKAALIAVVKKQYLIETMRMK